eukprot:5935705-Prymnesium_polylepis.1
MRHASHHHPPRCRRLDVAAARASYVAGAASPPKGQDHGGPGRGEGGRTEAGQAQLLRQRRQPGHQSRQVHRAPAGPADGALQRHAERR